MTVVLTHLFKLLSFFPLILFNTGISETIQIYTWLLQIINRQPVVYQIISLILSPGHLTKDDSADDLESHLKVSSRIKRFQYLYLKTSASAYYYYYIIIIIKRFGLVVTRWLRST